jgi:hypothetical protein
MKRAQWLNKRRHACETIRCEDGKQVACVVVNDAGRSADGFGDTEERAFKAAHDKYAADRARAKLTTRVYGGRL